METRETLEAALAAAWDTDTLAVYADHLQAEGDVRGELIALDLEIAAHGSSSELAKRRTSLLYAWLGALVPVDNVHASWVGDSLRFGFVEELVFRGDEPNALARLAQVLASPAGPYVRGLMLTGTPDELAAALRAIATRTHPFLARLALRAAHAGPIAADAVTAALAAMPRLAELELHRGAVAAVSNPAIRRLVLYGRDSYVALGEGAAFPAVTDLAIDLATAEAWDPDDAFLAEDDLDAEPAPRDEIPLPRVAFPALVRLDLGAGTELDPALRFLRELDARTHVEHLVIPALRSAGERAELAAALRDLPALATIELAHGSYYDPPDLPAVRFTGAAPWPWPTPDRARGRGVLVYQPRAKFGDPVALGTAVLVMERVFEALPRPARAAWTRLWTAIATLAPAGAAFPAHVLAEAVDAVPELMQDGWRELREELAARRPLADDAIVKLEPCAA